MDRFKAKLFEHIAGYGALLLALLLILVFGVIVILILGIHL